MNTKKKQLPTISKLKAAKEQAYFDYVAEKERIDKEIEKYWVFIAKKYIKVNSVWRLPDYKRGTITITNITERFIVYKIDSKISKYDEYYKKKLSFGKFGEFIYLTSPEFRYKVLRNSQIDEILGE